MRVLITGSNGFIGKNLLLKLREFNEYDVSCFTREDKFDLLNKLVNNADVIIHLAGENRPTRVADFALGNAKLTKKLCSVIKLSKHKPLLILPSSIQATIDNPYGKSKLDAEQAVKKLSIESGNPVVVYRLPGVFGKWCRPNYNSVVATFCHNIANDLPIKINDPLTDLRLVYIDDVVTAILNSMNSIKDGLHWGKVMPEYLITLGELAEQIKAFKNCRSSLLSERVGGGIVRALYATYVSYLPTTKFIYDLSRHCDDRGVFVEMLKTPDCGQFSFFSAHPGVTRGGHYHHSKSEKFIVIKGEARFGFRNVITGESFEITTSGEQTQVVETIPGWAHDITNIGEGDMFVMLWSSEIFDRDKPDTIPCEV